MAGIRSRLGSQRFPVFCSIKNLCCVQKPRGDGEVGTDVLAAGLLKVRGFSIQGIVEIPAIITRNNGRIPTDYVGVGRKRVQPSAFFLNIHVMECACQTSEPWHKRAFGSASKGCLCRQVRTCLRG